MLQIDIISLQKQMLKTGREIEAVHSKIQE